MCHNDHVTMPGEAAPLESTVLMGDPRVTDIPASDNGENLVDIRDYGLRVSSFRADDAGDFAHVRTGLAVRLIRAAEALPRGTRTSCLLKDTGRQPCSDATSRTISAPCARPARAAKRNNSGC